MEKPVINISNAAIFRNTTALQLESLFDLVFLSDEVFTWYGSMNFEVMELVDRDYATSLILGLKTVMLKVVRESSIKGSLNMENFEIPDCLIESIAFSGDFIKATKILNDCFDCFLELDLNEGVTISEIYRINDLKRFYYMVLDNTRLLVESRQASSII